MTLTKMMHLLPITTSVEMTADNIHYKSLEGSTFKRVSSLLNPAGVPNLEHINKAMVRGTCIHLQLEAFLQQALAEHTASRQPLDELMDTKFDEIEKASKKLKPFYEISTLDGWGYYDIKPYIEQLVLLLEQRGTQVHAYRLEMTFGYDNGDHFGVKRYVFGGTIDLVLELSNEVLIVDWKSGKWYPKYKKQAGAYLKALSGMDKGVVFAFVLEDSFHLIDDVDDRLEVIRTFEEAHDRNESLVDDILSTRKALLSTHRELVRTHEQISILEDELDKLAKHYVLISPSGSKTDSTMVETSYKYVQEPDVELFNKYPDLVARVDKVFRRVHDED